MAERRELRMVTGGRVPPNDLGAEASVLGGVLLSNDALDVTVEILAPEDFYSEANRHIYQGMLELAKNGQPVDLVTLRAQLESAGKLPAVGGDDYLFSLTNTIPAVANIEAHARIVREKAIVRGLISACHEITSRGYADYGPLDQFLDGAEKSIFDVSKERIRHPYEHVRSVVTRTFEQISAAAERKEHITGLPTGFTQLDKKTAGMHPGELIIVAGRPSMGKTALALNVAVNAARSREGVQVVFFSLEMPKEQLASRMLCSEARVDASLVRTGNIPRDSWPALVQAANDVSELPIWIDDTPGLSLMELRAKARRLKVERGLSLVIVDYLQLMRSGTRTESREQEISEISRSLKGLAKELSLPVMALSQLNRGVETRGTKDKRPQLSDLRESGAIEQDADTIIFVYRDEVYDKESRDKGIAELIVGKQRQGPTGTVRCSFSHEHTRFGNLQEYAEEPEEAYDA
jgi:replicative DNA helicase